MRVSLVWVAFLVAIAGLPEPAPAGTNTTRKVYILPIRDDIMPPLVYLVRRGGNGVERVPDTYESKMTSAVRAMVRTSAEKNGYNIAVVEAMIDKTRGLTLTNVVDGVTNQVVIARQGEILTLTNTEAEREYGNPPKKLLSSGTVKDLDELLKLLGYAGAQRHEIKPTGMERLGTWLNTISPLLLIIG